MVEIKRVLFNNLVVFYQYFVLFFISGIPMPITLAWVITMIHVPHAK
jgi:hypothetical protein